MPDSLKNSCADAGDISYWIQGRESSVEWLQQCHPRARKAHAWMLVTASIGYEDVRGA